MVARSMNGKLLSKRQFRTVPRVVTTHFTSIVPSIPPSSASGVYTGSGPSIFLGGYNNRSTASSGSQQSGSLPDTDN